MGDPQNRDNMLPSRPSTKVHHAPGGGSSICLSWDSPPEKEKKKQIEEHFVPPQPQQPQQAAVPSAPKTISSNVWANQNCGNVLTDRPTTRLHAPPGGKSSITFG